MTGDVTPSTESDLVAQGIVEAEEFVDQLDESEEAEVENEAQDSQAFETGAADIADVLDQRTPLPFDDEYSEGVDLNEIDEEPER